MHGLEEEYWGQVDFVYLDRENSANRDLVDRFNVRGQPVFILVDSSGNELRRWFNADATGMRQAMNEVLAASGG